MTKYIHLIISFFAILSFSACSLKIFQKGDEVAQAENNPDKKPIWIDKPYIHPKVQGKIFAIGSAGENIRGEEAQRLKAISIAIDKIARQKGVKVNSTLSRVQSVKNSHQSSSIDSYSVQTVEGKVISTRIVDFWKDPISKKFYVLMVGE